MNIRIAVNDDIASLDNIQTQYFEKNTLEDFKYLVSSDNYIVFVAEVNNNIVGYICASLSVDSSDILQICVVEKYRRQKIASSLLNHYLEYLKNNGIKNIFLEVNENNQSALKLYDKFDFSVISKRKNYYGNQSAIIMKKDL